MGTQERMNRSENLNNGRPNMSRLEDWTTETEARIQAEERLQIIWIEESELTKTETLAMDEHKDKSGMDAWLGEGSVAKSREISETTKKLTFENCPSLTPSR